MCGIVGYIGSKQAAPILLDGLSKLEYRGYDSAGIAVRDGADKFKVVKAKGRLKGLIEKTDEGRAVPVVLVIRDGQHTASRPSSMHIRISAMMAMWLASTMVLLRIIRS